MKATDRPASVSARSQPATFWQRLTRFALGMAVAIVIARVTTNESLRDPWQALPGGTSAPRGAGPASALVFDLIALFPMLLVLLRATFDSTFQLIFRRSTTLLAAGLSLWTLASAFWATDKFAAIVHAANLAAGFSLLWSFSQLVRTPSRLRFVSATAFGLLLLLAAHALLYRFVDLPDLVRNFQEHQKSLLAERQIDADSFAAKQVALKVTNGELVGFFVSPNTFAAVAVVLLTISFGIGWQRLRDRDGAAWWLLLLAAVGASLCVIIQAKSKTAVATPVLGLILFVVAAFTEHLRQRKPARTFWIAVTVLATGAIAVIGHGLYRHGLFPGHLSNSLDFRWKYWVASWAIFKQHLLIGIGWASFGSHYLAVRLPEASEEIKDPHNVFVRIFVELGLVGGVLAVAWLITAARFIWQPREMPQDEKPERTGWAVWTLACAMGFEILASIDFSQSGAYLTMELLRRLLFFLALVLGTIVACMQSPQKFVLDDRPAPWIRRGLIIAVALFLLHNQIDFSLFEPGAMFAAAMFAGTALATSSSDNRASKTESRVYMRGFAGGSLALISIAAIVAVFVLVVPVIRAEQLAHDADDQIRTSPMDDPATGQMQLVEAASKLTQAFDTVPYNYDYAFRAARANFMIGNAATADALLDKAIAANPMAVEGLVLKANSLLARKPLDSVAVTKTFERIVQLAPHDASLRLEYASALDRLNMPLAAKDQYQAALAINASLPAEEPRRLSADELQKIEARLAK